MSTLSHTITTELADLVIDPAQPPVSATLAVVPRSVDDLVRVVSVAIQHGATLTPVGSGSMSYGIDADIAVVTSGLSGVVDYQPDDLTIVVGAGTTLAELDSVLADRNLSAVLPETAPDRTVGGVVATGASGYHRLSYGPTRDRVLEVTMVTGYGEIVRAGGRLVKNVTGYDLSRLATGSLGSLGIIASVCFKLWPVSQVRRTVSVDDAAAALGVTYRPVAVLETASGSAVYLQGEPTTIDQQVDRLRGTVTDGFSWPNPAAASVRIAMRVPPRDVASAIHEVRRVDAEWFIAQHGVGVIDIGAVVFDSDAVHNLRSWAEERGGSVFVSAPDLSTSQRWGTPPSTIDIQRRMKRLFDPAGICNPGVLPGGL